MPRTNPQDIFALLEQWDSASYDGVRGQLPDWVPEMMANTFVANRYIVAGEIFEKRLSLSGALNHLAFHIKKEKLLREEDRLQEVNKDKEAFAIGSIINRLQFPETSALNDAIAVLANIHEDLKLEKDVCLYLWLGQHISENNRIGERQRDYGAVGGRKSGELRRISSLRGEILRLARLRRKNGEPRRGLANVIKSEGGFTITVRQINSILKEAMIE